MKEDIVVIIPAYNPDEKLIQVIKDLEQNEYVNIVVVNDGSNDIQIFERIKNKAIIIKHETNQGQGRAVKTGIRYVLDNCKNIRGIITMDADGQHRVEDLNNLYKEFSKNDDVIILGSRDFLKKNVPLRSKIGNIIISKMLAKKTNVYVKDTQTGMRIIPEKYLKQFEEIKGERFEFAICSIIYFIKNNVPFKELPIQSVYIDGNSSSHYKPIRDSIKIYRLMHKELKK